MKTPVGILALSILGAAVALACTPADPDNVALEGFLVEGPSEPSSTVIVPGGTARVLSRESADFEEEYSSAIAGADGFFRVGGLPPSTAVALVVGKPDGGDPHSFGVFTGLTENVDLTLFVGAAFTPPLQDSLDLIAEYEAAPSRPAELDTYTIDLNPGTSNGGMIRGRVGRWISAEFGLVFQTVEGAVVEVTVPGDTQPREICYRAEPVDPEPDGVVDCQATATSIDSRFAVFGLPPGQVTIRVDAPNLPAVSDTTVIVEDGVTYLDFFAVAFP